MDLSTRDEPRVNLRGAISGDSGILRGVTAGLVPIVTLRSCDASSVTRSIRANIDGALDELPDNVAAIRQAWPKVTICIRGDSVFCRAEMMAGCEHHAVDFVLGPARELRLERLVSMDMNKAKVRRKKSREAYRSVKELRYGTHDNSDEAPLDRFSHRALGPPRGDPVLLRMSERVGPRDGRRRTHARPAEPSHPIDPKSTDSVRALT